MTPQIRPSSLIAIFLVTTLALGACGGSAKRPEPRPAPGHLVLGISANLSGTAGADRDEVARLVRRTRARLVREDISWAAAEPRPGRFDWARADETFRYAAARRLTVLPVVDGPPSWARGYDPPAFAAFIARLVRRYRAPYFELLNEPYVSGEISPAAYARLVKRAVTAGRRANPRARFLIAGELDWTPALYDAVPDLSRYVDAVAVHPYGRGSPALLTPGPEAHEQIRRVELIHDALTDHGDGSKPIWITEIGWSTCPDDPENCVSEARQAGNLRAALRLARTTWKRYVRGFVVYRLRDTPGQNPSDKEDWFGLRRADATPKPAWSVFSR